MLFGMELALLVGVNEKQISRLLLLEVKSQNLTSTINQN